MFFLGKGKSTKGLNKKSHTASKDSDRTEGPAPPKQPRLLQTPDPAATPPSFDAGAFKIPKKSRPFTVTEQHPSQGQGTTLDPINYCDTNACASRIRNNTINCAALLPKDICNVDTLCFQMENLIIASKTNATWAKHFSAWNAYAEFCNQYKITAWPASEQSTRAFATWLICARKLKANTAKAYISSLNLGNSLANCANSSLLSDGIVKMIIKGGTNSELSALSRQKAKLSINPFMIQILGHRIANLQWTDISKQVVWAAMLTCYFTSCRMGELLCDNEKFFTEKKTLLWKHINFSIEDGALIFLPCTKTKGMLGEFVDIFFFDNKNFCPVTNLLKLRHMLTSNNIYNENFPVFMLKPGKFLTKNKMNLILADLLDDLYDKDKFKITCHSFRTGIPTVLDSSGPESQNSIKEWGRWVSDSFTLYTRGTRVRRKAIFNNVCDMLSDVLK